MSQSKPIRNLMRILLLFLISSFITLQSCEKPIIVCGCEKPLKELSWLESTLERYVFGDVYVYRHDDGDYIGFSTEEYASDWLVVIFNCSGDLICNVHFRSSPCDIFSSPREFLFTANYID